MGRGWRRYLVVDSPYVIALLIKILPETNGLPVLWPPEHLYRMRSVLNALPDADVSGLTANLRMVQDKRVLWSVLGGCPMPYRAYYPVRLSFQSTAARSFSTPNLV